MADGPEKPPADDAPARNVPAAGASPDDASVLRLVGQTATVGFEFLATVLLPTALGYWLDRRLGTLPWLMIALGVFGFGVGLYRMLRTAAEAMK